MTSASKVTAANGHQGAQPSGAAAQAATAATRSVAAACHSGRESGVRGDSATGCRGAVGAPRSCSATPAAQTTAAAIPGSSMCATNAPVEIPSRSTTTRFVGLPVGTAIDAAFATTTPA